MVQKMQPEWQTVNKMTLPYSNGPKHTVMVQEMQPEWQTVNKMALPYSNGPKDAARIANSEQDDLTIQ